MKLFILIAGALAAAAALPAHAQTFIDEGDVIERPRANRVIETGAGPMAVPPGATVTIREITIRPAEPTETVVTRRVVRAEAPSRPVVRERVLRERPAVVRRTLVTNRPARRAPADVVETGSVRSVTETRRTIVRPLPQPRPVVDDEFYDEPVVTRRPGLLPRGPFELD